MDIIHHTRDSIISISILVTISIICWTLYGCSIKYYDVQKKNTWYKLYNKRKWIMSLGIISTFLFIMMFIFLKYEVDAYKRMKKPIM